MKYDASLAIEQVEEMLGEEHPLIEQLDSTEGMVCIETASASVNVRQINDRPSLRRFLTAYKRDVLFPVELPAIFDAFRHARGNETRELIARDQKMADVRIVSEFSSASRRIGRNQLARFRPMRDDRFVQRYLAAVEEGRAHGWHTMVYGVTLALYSVPLRQGLQTYAHQTLRGFIRSAAATVKLNEKECQELLDELCFDVIPAVEKLIASTDVA